MFDLDGTLVDSAIDLQNAINYAVGPFNIQPVTVEETRSLVGEGLARLMEKVVEKGMQSSADRMRLDDGQKLIDTLVERFTEHYWAHIVDNTRPYPFVMETLNDLHEFKKAVVSNKREGPSSIVLNALGLAAYMDMIVGGDTAADKKPSPVPIRHVLDKFGLKPEEAVIVGDSDIDIEAGKAAGIFTVGATWGYRPLELLKDADFLINGMHELPGILRAIT